jgi:hypothetical protein
MYMSSMHYTYVYQVGQCFIWYILTMPIPYISCISVLRKYTTSSSMLHALQIHDAYEIYMVFGA